MIPKKIHYCWVGGNPIPDNLQKCIDSWKKYCPDYEIIRWDESNYDFSKNRYMWQAYTEKKWGFVPDYARLDIIYNEGGIYLDTDVELVKSLDSLLDDHAFVGCETVDSIALGLGFGAEKGNQVIKRMLDEYDTYDFVKSNGELNLKPSPEYQTEFFNRMGFESGEKIQKIEEITIYPTQYFNPTDLNTGKVNLCSETFSIHHYSASWLSPKKKIRYSFHKFLNRLIGVKATDLIRTKIFHLQ